MLDMDPTTFEMEPLPLDLCPNNIAGIGYAKTIEVDNPDVLPAHLQNGGVDMTSEEQEDSNDDDRQHDDNSQHDDDRQHDEDSHHDEDGHHDDNGMGRRRSEDDNSGESDENKGGVTGYSKEIYCVAENGGPALVVIEFDVCPDVVLTLGAAF